MPQYEHRLDIKLGKFEMLRNHPHSTNPMECNVVTHWSCRNMELIYRIGCNLLNFIQACEQSSVSFHDDSFNIADIQGNNSIDLEILHQHGLHFEWLALSLLNSDRMYLTRLLTLSSSFLICAVTAI
jgi:hypothetical protein